jgi:DNA modification methylase
MQTARLESLHRFHPYCARFPSDIVENALTTYTRPGDSIFDPFCGSGTTLVAGLAHTRKVAGGDIDLLAGMLTELKCRPRPIDSYRKWRLDFGTRLATAFREIESGWRQLARISPGRDVQMGSLTIHIPGFPELNYWFPPRLTISLATIAALARRCKEPHYAQLALVSLSACIISKWPNTLSYAMDIDHTRPHRRVQRFTLKRILDTYLARLDRTIACLAALYEVFDRAGVATRLIDSGRIFYPHDARQKLAAIEDESQALVITSPPYFDAVDYPRAHRMSLCWMNGYAPADLASRRKYLGLRRAPDFVARDWLSSRPEVRRLIPAKIREYPSIERNLTAFLADLEAVLGQAFRVLRPGAHGVFVIANNVIRGERIRTHEALVELAQSVGFTALRTSSRKIASLRRRFPVGPFGFDGPMTHEYAVVLGKPKSRRRRSKDEEVQKA